MTTIDERAELIRAEIGQGFEMSTNFGVVKYAGHEFRVFDVLADDGTGSWALLATGTEAEEIEGGIYPFEFAKGELYALLSNLMTVTPAGAVGEAIALGYVESVAGK